jgi:hypothetical protein
MADHFKITDKMKAKVGSESPPWTFEVTTTGVRAFARGIGITDPVYYDIAAAKEAGYPNLPVPLTYNGTPVFIPGQSDETFSMPLNSDMMIDHGLLNTMDGGKETEYFEQVYAGDILTCVTCLDSLDLKVTGSGNHMLITTIKFTFTNQQGKVAVVEKLKVINH